MHLGLDVLPCDFCVCVNLVRRPSHNVEQNSPLVRLCVFCQSWVGPSGYKPPLEFGTVLWWDKRRPSVDGNIGQALKVIYSSVTVT